MWKYKKQITVRWASFLLSLAMLLSLFFVFKDNAFGTFSKESFKSAFVGFSVFMDSLPIWALTIASFVIVILFYLGVPTSFVFVFLLIAYGFYTAFILSIFTQGLVSIFSVYLSYRNGNKEEAQSEGNLDEKLVLELKNMQDQSKGFVFWSRVYNLFPLRTMDLMTAFVVAEKSKVKNHIVFIFFGLIVRMIIPFSLINSIYRLLSTVGGNSSELWNNFFLWSFLMLVFVIIPRAPEIMICPQRFKKPLFLIVPYSIFVKKKKKVRKKVVKDNEGNEAEVEGAPVEGELEGVQQEGVAGTEEATTP